MKYWSIARTSVTLAPGMFVWRAASAAATTPTTREKPKVDRFCNGESQATPNVGTPDNNPVHRRPERKSVAADLWPIRRLD